MYRVAAAASAHRIACPLVIYNFSEPVATISLLR